MTIALLKLNNLLDNDTLLPRLHSSSLHLKLIRPVLLRILYDLDLTRQFPSLSNGNESRAQTLSDNGTKQEPSGVKTDNDVRSVPGVLGSDVVNEVSDKSLECEGVLEDGEDVEEGDSLGGLSELCLTSGGQHLVNSQRG